MFIIKELKRFLFWWWDFQPGTQPNSLKQKENVFPISSAVKFKLQLNECVHFEICLDEGFSKHIPTYVSTKSYCGMINYFENLLWWQTFRLTCGPHIRWRDGGGRGGIIWLSFLVMRCYSWGLISLSNALEQLFYNYSLFLANANQSLQFFQSLV